MQRHKHVTCYHGNSYNQFGMVRSKKETFRAAGIAAPKPTCSLLAHELANNLDFISAVASATTT